MAITPADELRNVSPEEHDNEVNEYLDQCRAELEEFIDIHAETLRNGGAAMFVPKERKGDLWRLVQVSLKAELEAAGYRAYLAPRTSSLLDDNDIRIEYRPGQNRAEARLPRLSGAELERHERLVNGEVLTEQPATVQVEFVDGEPKSSKVVQPEAKYEAPPSTVVENPATDGQPYADPVEGVDVNGVPNDTDEPVSRRGRNRN